MSKSIIFELKIKQDNNYLEYLRNEGLLFDTIRETLLVEEDELEEISFDEYKIIEKYRNDKSRSNKKSS